MKNIAYSILLGTVIILLASCRNDFEFTESVGALEFSQDTVFLDTVFTNIGSSTRTVKVYNRSDEDILIPQVRLRQGDESLYRLAVDGVPGRVFENVELLANDSLFVFIETTVDINTQTDDDEFLYLDTIDFGSSGDFQSVELVTLIKDAIFLFPERDDEGIEESLLLGVDQDENEIRIRGFVLDEDELTFTNEKPYVIYGFAAIPNDQTLTIEAGARLFFHDGSGIIASNESTLKVNGAPSLTEALENEVIFQGDRLEPAFNDLPGQWTAIWLTAGSKDHEISHLTIRNSSVGIIMDSQSDDDDGATLRIDNTQIYNSANNGILASTASIDAENLVINNSGQSSVVLRLGGEYNFNNCTIANFFPNGLRQDPALFISNTIPNSGLSEPLENAVFTNCIIYGDRDLELLILDDEVSDLNFKFENSLIKFEDRFGELEDISVYDFSNTDLYEQVILNEEPFFKNAARNELQISNESAANGLGNPATVASLDITQAARDAGSPDAGAYESVTFEED
ncbi:right-handed parallel beta-helix repeat-containing protein [Nonlabens ponticola]|uniref:Right handed beta helix domain-containing protein n=1 Tax=Nonlabens ponticola TaxID=2496866 RepID=A0A3S9MY10_9FLAO|nr:right-handed parallel beta-helix repeat-containing protein [Nonlabens ponticola]AZQ44080.1 hypothetical protein EJ995_07490 [Nonlabens ponticola]